MGFIVQSFGRERMTEMPCPKGYNLLLATRVLFERCARATLLEQNQNVRFCSSHKVEDLLYEETARSVQGRLHTSASRCISWYVVSEDGYEEREFSGVVRIYV